jgi:hypothetical protein
MVHPLFDLLFALDTAHIRYTLSRDRSDTVRVNVTVVGERVEVDVFEDGHMEVSRFVGSEAVEGDALLIKRLIADNSQDPAE